MNFDSINRKLSISEMAQIHDISRQTLIYYDKIGLFKPAITDEENGYRYYSTLQIPLLREICFLRSIGMPLDEIRKNNEYNNSRTTMELLESQKQKIEKEIAKLTEQRKKINKRMQIYQNAYEYENEDYKPAIMTFPERYVLHYPWDPDDRTIHGIHYSLMKVWNIAEKYGVLPSRRWGALIFKDELEKGDPLVRAGSCTIIAEPLPDQEHQYVLEAGEYACMPKYGMAYDMSQLQKLMHWINYNGYEIAGNIYDECLIDAIFYDDEYELDFCELQVPIRKKT